MGQLDRGACTVLVVEDDPLVLMAAADALREHGLIVVEASDAAQAMVIMAGSDDVDLLFSDVRMPGAMDGFGLAQWAAAQRPGMKIIITSGEVGTGKAPAGFDWQRDFIPKPYRLSDIAVRIKSALAS